MDLQTLLTGDWILKRRLGHGATLNGTLALVPDGGGTLSYLEAGILRLPNGSQNDARRAYTYRVDGQRLDIFFADGPDSGRPFLSLVFTRHAKGYYMAEDIHYCGDDTYRARFKIWPDDARIMMAYRITGPRKDEVYVSFCRKLSVAPA